MIKTKTISRPLAVLFVVALLGFLSGIANATIPGATSKSSTPTFNLMAMADVISTSDGDSMWMWGYGCSDVTCTKNLINKYQMQFPGPTLIVNQGDRVTINLRNRLPLPVSIVFPGQTVTASGGSQTGLLTREAAAANPGATTDSVTYKFTASQPGTYIYYSGTRSDLEVEMGMVGTIIVRPTGYADTTCPANATYTTSCRKAYGDPSAAYDREYLFLLSEADPVIHRKVALASPGTLSQIQARIALIDTTKRHAVDWFINGRNFPDTMSDPNDAGSGLFPTQPYNCMPMMQPAEKVLIRVVSAGMDFHPLHTHGQNHLVIARDGRLLSSNAGQCFPSSCSGPGSFGFYNDIGSGRDSGCNLGSMDRS